MGPGAAEIKSRNGRCELRRLRVRAQAEDLVEVVAPVKDVAFGQAEHALEVERCQELPPDDQASEVWHESFERRQDAVGYRWADVVPALPVGQAVRIVLPDQAHHVVTPRRE